MRGADGFLHPYDDATVAGVISCYQRSFGRLLPHYTAQRLDGLRVRAWVMEDSGSLGTQLVVALDQPDEGTMLAAASFERDLDLETEDPSWEPAWVLQGLFVIPHRQRHGLGTQLLRLTHYLTGLRLVPDTQMTVASARLWEKLADELGRAPASADEPVSLPVQQLRGVLERQVTHDRQFHEG